MPSGAAPSGPRSAWNATDGGSLPTATTDRAFDIVRAHVNQ